MDLVTKIQDAMRAYGIWCQMKEREAWSREKLSGYQEKQLAHLVAHACARSPYYRELYKGIDLGGQIKLQDLPVVTKKSIMENFDRVITDPKINLTSLYSHVDQIKEDQLYAGEYRILTTAGTSGFRGVFLYDFFTWSTLLAAVMRVGDFMGISPLRPLRITAIGGSSPVHLSFRRAEAMDFGIHKVQRLVVTNPVEQLVADMNSFQPDYIHAYPSIATLLAEEQLEGRLKIQPEYLLTGAELVTEAMRNTISQAWGILPFESYSSTEGMLAAECGHHRGLHIFEDILIAEVVDAEYQPVPDGTPGAKILLTNLFQFKEPLIRYEISDMVTIDPEPCGCGRPFRRIKTIFGRHDDVFYLEGISGEPVPFHPMNFQFYLTTFPGVKEYRVVLGDEGITVFIVPRGEWSESSDRDLTQVFMNKFAEMKVRPPVLRIRKVKSIKRDDRFMGKMVIVAKGIEDVVVEE